MGILCCLTAVIRGRKKGKEDASSSTTRKTLQIRLEPTVKPLENDGVNEFPSGERVTGKEALVIPEVTEREYEGEDEREENISIRRDFSDFDLQAHAESPQAGQTLSAENHFNAILINGDQNVADKVESGHVSDPGIARVVSWASPELKRSCSNLETSEVLSKMANHLPLSKSQSFEAIERLPELMREKDCNLGSPASLATHASADKVMLKKHSSSQILPSRSRRLWWKLFLWSHRNVHKAQASSKPRLLLKPVTMNQQSGYSSDIVDLSQTLKVNKMESPGSYTGESLSMELPLQGSFADRACGLWPQNQWVAFSAESSALTRVDEWVNNLSTHSVFPGDDNEEDNSESNVIFPPSPEDGRSPRHPEANISDAVSHANNIIQSLNKSSTVAYISGTGLKAIPSISHFVSLRSVNLSNNFIARITSGSLPKSLHVLNLSKNKISTIEGLRELSRLRVLDISYNRIFRIGQGLSKCTMIKELYLAGNKIGDIEGLHRLLKLKVVDLSFNKITTTKSIGQLVANYNSLVALNLVGNPIQSNVSDDQLRKAVCGLLPKLVYLNKRPIKPQRGREVIADGIAKAALGTNATSARRKRGKSSSRLAASNGRSSNAGNVQKGRSRAKNRSSHQ